MKILRCSQIWFLFWGEFSSVHDWRRAEASVCWVIMEAPLYATDVASVMDVGILIDSQVNWRQEEKNMNLTYLHSWLGLMFG